MLVSNTSLRSELIIKILERGSQNFIGVVDGRTGLKNLISPHALCHVKLIELLIMDKF